jgi:ABC-type lipoprotein release transport system permease subunit
MLSIQGLYDGMTKHLIESTIRSESGEVTLYAPSYRLQQKLKYHLTNTKETVDSLGKMAEVTAIAERIRVMGLLSTAHKSTMAKLIGVDRDKENAFGNFKEFIVEGEFGFGEEKNGAVIGKKLAKTLGVRVGSRVIFSTQDIDGELSSISLRIKGVVQTTNLAIDDRALFVDLDRAESLTGLTGGERTEIALRTRKGVDLMDLKSKLKTEWSTLEIYTWNELYPALEQMQVMMTIFNGITFGIVMVMVFIGILGVMFVSILERIREFGILLAIGEPYRYLRFQVLFEALLLGAGGYIIGSISGAAALYYFQVHGLDLSAFSAGLEEFGMNSILYATIEVYYFTFTLTAIILAALLSVILPLKKIKKLHPIDVIQGE